jgi:23S rRNA (guanosine2251-2'-O)-methyltransferase
MRRKQKPGKPVKAAPGGDPALRLYGRHAVEAALNNPEREKRQLYGAPKALAALKDSGLETRSVSVETTDNERLASLVGPEVPHQGLVLEVRPLPGRHIEDLAPDPARPHNLVVALDHLSDPQNVGAIFRSAAAFGARAILTTYDHAPRETGALAKAASGALEVVPWVRVTNLAAALDKLKDMGYWHLGLEGTAEASLAKVDLGSDLVLVLGGEGRGLRPRTREKCDLLVRLPISDAIESLNVSAAAAVALYELSHS